MKILLVEDDPDLRTLVRTYMTRNGIEVMEAGDGQSMLDAVGQDRFDLILLDLALPDGDGLNLLRDVRKTDRTPVIMLTGRTETVDRVVGLELGADDYICKPFELRELLARMRAVLRRALEAPQGEAAGSTLGFAGWSLDVARRRLVSPEGGDVQLTSGEFDLLKVLAEHANRPMTRERLLETTRARSWEPFDRSVDVLLGRLRKKIERDPKNPEIIKTVRNIGYVLIADPQRRADQPAPALVGHARAAFDLP